MFDSVLGVGVSNVAFLTDCTSKVIPIFHWNLNLTMLIVSGEGIPSSVIVLQIFVKTLTGMLPVNICMVTLKKIFSPHETETLFGSIIISIILTI